MTSGEFMLKSILLFSAKALFFTIIKHVLSDICHIDIELSFKLLY